MNKEKIMKQKLIEAAKKVSKNAYVPYSGFHLGAALLTKSGKIFTGCNVENASYGLTNCAERTAIFKAVSEGETEFTELVIYSDTDKLFYPCGACRQVISEFSSDLKITIISLTDELETDIATLLPHGFNLDK
jgi:cytidine deaminase